MAGQYELWLTDDYGKRIQSLDYSLGFTATRVDGAIDTLNLSLPSTFDTRLLRPDFGLQVWRAPPTGRLNLFQHYLIRKWRLETHGAAERLLIWGRGPKDLLRRRIIAYYAGEAESDKTALEADDMMKEIVSEMIADGAAPAPTAGTRVWSDLSVQADVTAGPQLTKAFAWQNVLRLIQSLQKASREAGTEVFFDIVPHNITSSSINFQFRTYTGQPGADRTDIVFAQGFGNLKNPYLEFDYSEEENYIYSGGQGQGNARDVQQVYDADRYNASQWNRCEGFAVATQQDAANGVREVGRARLEAGRPRLRFGADAIDTAGTRFARDWNFGDRVTARYRDYEFQAIARAVTLSMAEGRETIAARLEYEESV
jgi:hypothetical protein